LQNRGLTRIIGCRRVNDGSGSSDDQKNQVVIGNNQVVIGKILARVSEFVVGLVH
jgi:hypothetical protein